MHHTMNLGAIARVNAAVGQGLTSNPITFSDIQCTGLEQRLVDCHKRDLTLVTSHSCAHIHDAGVECVAGVYKFMLM